MKKYLFIFLVFPSCIRDQLHEVLYVKNKSIKNVLVYVGYTDVTDTIAVYSAPGHLKSGESTGIYRLGLALNPEGKAIFTFLDMDTVRKYTQSGITPGVAMKAFLCKYYCKVGDTLVLK